jgi:hypothetical protein
VLEWMPGSPVCLPSDVLAPAPLSTGVMRFSVIPSSYPEYCALRTRNRSLALVCQAGHAALAMSPFFVVAAVVIVVVAHIDPEIARERSPWPVVAALLLWAMLCVGLGMGLRRYAIRKAGAT